MTRFEPPDDGQSHPPFWRTRYGLGWALLAAVAGFFLVTQHLAHLMGALPYLIFLACPLMHLFMHHGHGHHHHDQDNHSAVEQGQGAGSAIESEQEVRPNGPR